MEHHGLARTGKLVLVLDADVEPALTVVRSLGRAGYRVHVAAPVPRAIAAYSRHSKSCGLYPDPLRDSSAFINWLASHGAAAGYDLIIPITERSLVPISEARDCLAELAIAMPKAASLNLALDKAATMTLAADLGIPVPAGHYVANEEQLLALADTLDYPLVIKPTRSLVSGNNRASQQTVAYACTADELFAIATHYLESGSLLLQPLFRGVGVGVEVLAKDGEVLYAFQHERIHEVPLSGGGSSLRKSAALNPLLLADTQRLIKAMDWTGVAMVEFKWNPQTHAYRLMEVNGRFWGSLPLASVAGADFPAMLARLLLEGETVFSPHYRLNVRCRKLSRDLLWYESVARRDYNPRIVEVERSARLFLDFFSLFSPRHYLDVQSFSDPVPGLVDLGSIFKDNARRLTSLINDKSLLYRHRRYWRNGTVRRALLGARTILFICYGNINRSALAEHLLAGYAEDLGITVCGAGFHEQEGRPRDPRMIAVAREEGTDLRGETSRCLNRAMLAQADIVFAMDISHLRRLHEEYPDMPLDRVFLLGAGTPASLWETQIADPYGKSDAAYRHCFNVVSRAVDELKAMLSKRLEEDS